MTTSLHGFAAVQKIVGFRDDWHGRADKDLARLSGALPPPGQMVGLKVELAMESVSIWSATLWLSGLGLAISLLIGWLILDGSRRRLMVQQLSTH